MSVRAVGVVTCAHCRREGARHECASCRLTVCDACAADWSSCGAPTGRMLRLGLTARLREVDAEGRVGLVSRWRGPVRRLDLRRLAWLDTPAPLPSYWSGRPLLVAGGVVVHRLLVGEYHRGLRFVDASGELGVRFDIGNGRLIRSSTGARLLCLRRDERLEVIDLLPRVDVRVFDLLPGEVLQWASLDDAARLLAVGTWGRVELYRLEAGGAPERLATIALAGHDVFWLASAGGRLAVVHGIGRAGHLATVSVWSLDESPRRADLGSVEQAALSPDGRYLATFDHDRRVAVHDLDRGATTHFDDLTTRPCLVAFADGGRTLILADYDNRVVIRPRRGDDFAGPTAVCQPLPA